MKGKILIAVPTFENIKPECFKSIYNLINPKDYLLYFDYVKGYDCARARNEIAKLAIEYNFDYFQPDIFFQLFYLSRLFICYSSSNNSI